MSKIELHFGDSSLKDSLFGDSLHMPHAKNSYADNPHANNILAKNPHTSKPLESHTPHAELYTETLAYNPALFTSLFPQCAKAMDSTHIEVLLASTRIVGMKTPGLHSIYSQLSIDFRTQSLSAESHNNKSPNLNSHDTQPLKVQDLDLRDDTHILYYTHKTHKLLNLTTITIHAPFSGVIKAFIRPQALSNESLSDISLAFSHCLESMPFRNQRALVIGAGSGFGNACAKILTLGGAKVLATTLYTPFDEPQCENLSTLNFNALQPTKASLRTIATFAPTHIYYFATPKIKAHTTKLSKTLLNEFVAYYIFGLDSMLHSLAPIASLQGIFQPSSCFVDELPLDLREYTIAKAALESYMNIIAKQYQLHIATPRLQKSATNQTLSLLPQNLDKPSVILIDEIFAFADSINYTESTRIDSTHFNTPTTKDNK